MAEKLDKSLYTKEQVKKILEQRRRKKEIERVQNEAVTNVQTVPKPLAHPNRTESAHYAFVLGNGTSRQTIDPMLLKAYGKIYGCNALYREFEPDYLVAVDVKMINEINTSGYQNTHAVWTNPNKAYKNYKNFNYFSPNKGWSSGPSALWFATQHTPLYKKIFILGFDYKGLEDGKIVNNIYAGTPNYKKTTDGATYYGNWLKQTAAVIKENTKIQFYRVILPDNFIPPELNKFSNLQHIYIEDFKKMFNIY